MIMTTNRRGFFEMSAGLISAIGLKAAAPKPDVLTMDTLNQLRKDLTNCEIYDDGDRFLGWNSYDSESL